MHFQTVAAAGDAPNGEVASGTPVTAKAPPSTPEAAQTTGGKRTRKSSNSSAAATAATEGLNASFDLSVLDQAGAAKKRVSFGKVFRKSKWLSKVMQ